tara:strand:- start:360 stop:473 length:114 start_codon:yes stop_codon:yes gene_type:complete
VLLLLLLPVLLRRVLVCRVLVRAVTLDPTHTPLADLL